MSLSDRAVACVKSGPLYPAHHVNVLRDMVRRHLPLAHRFVCLTDDPSGLASGIEPVELTPGRVGWWNKVELFRPGIFNGHVLYCDLDVCIVGPLARFFEARGIPYLTDWGWTRHCYCSSVMVWEAGEHAKAWHEWTPEIANRLHGDQDWLTLLGGWDRLPARWCCSYRYHAVNGPPVDASVVCFHGAPKPHQLPPEHWANDVWRLAA
jgi:hypothetical protein